MKFGLRRKRDCSVFSLGHSVINPLNSLSRSTSTYPTAAMKRTPSARAPSPTNTTYSGISNYRTDQYKPLREKSRNPSQAMDPKAIARIHHEEMAAYLENHLAKGTRASLSSLLLLLRVIEPANARASAREKLTRLTRQQFQELSTDVYDELLRRKNNTENEGMSLILLSVRGCAKGCRTSSQMGALVVHMLNSDISRHAIFSRVES